jgi:hypothetical protein
MQLADTVDGSRQIKGTSGAAHTLEQGVIGGERNTSSATNNYDAVHEETNYTRFAPGNTTETVITSAPCFVYGFIGVVGTGTLTLRDSATAAAATSPFPAFTLAVAGRVDFPAVRFESGLTAQLGTGTDVATIFWRPIG